MGVEPTTFQLVAQRLHQVRYRVTLTLVARAGTQNSSRTEVDFLSSKQPVNRLVFIDFSSHATNY
jgi:hypothetical protein